jgi:hypothetical protein
MVEISSHILKELQILHTNKKTERGVRVWREEVSRINNKTYKWDVQVSVDWKEDSRRLTWADFYGIATSLKAYADVGIKDEEEEDKEEEMEDILQHMTRWKLVTTSNTL